MPPALPSPTGRRRASDRTVPLTLCSMPTLVRRAGVIATALGLALPTTVLEAQRPRTGTRPAPVRPAAAARPATPRCPDQGALDWSFSRLPYGETETVGVLARCAAPRLRDAVATLLEGGSHEAAMGAYAAIVALGQRDSTRCAALVETAHVHGHQGGHALRPAVTAAAVSGCAVGTIAVLVDSVIATRHFDNNADDGWMAGGAKAMAATLLQAATRACDANPDEGMSTGTAGSLVRRVWDLEQPWRSPELSAWISATLRSRDPNCSGLQWLATELRKRQAI